MDKIIYRYITIQLNIVQMKLTWENHYAFFFLFFLNIFFVCFCFVGGGVKVFLGVHTWKQDSYRLSYPAQQEFTYGIMVASAWYRGVKVVVGGGGGGGKGHRGQIPERCQGLLHLQCSCTEQYDFYYVSYVRHVAVRWAAKWAKTNI